MAKPIRRGKTWRVEICVSGQRESFSAPHKATCEIWAADRKRELQALSRGEVVAGKTLHDALKRFSEEVSANRKGARWEQTRLSAWRKPASESPTSIPFVGVALDKITPDMIAAWRDERLKTVSPGAVRRDFSLLSSVLTRCRTEWRWMAANPLADVSKPQEPRGRDRRVTDAELELIRLQLGDDLGTVMGRLYWAAKFAVCTAMRKGEICALRWPDIGEKSLQVTATEIGAGKTDQARRAVPLSLEARSILVKMRGIDDDSVFLLNKGSADVFWRRAAKSAGLIDCHFHDLRHEGISRLAGRIDVMALARMIGHSDPKMLLRYYHPDADDLADRLG